MSGEAGESPPVGASAFTGSGSRWKAWAKRTGADLIGIIFVTVEGSGCEEARGGHCNGLCAEDSGSRPPASAPRAVRGGISRGGVLKTLTSSWSPLLAPSLWRKQLPRQKPRNGRVGAPGSGASSASGLRTAAPGGPGQSFHHAAPGLRTIRNG